MDIMEKYERLKKDIEKAGRVVVAFSGGVDSTFLLKVCKDTLGTQNVIAVTATSPIRFQEDFENTRNLAKEMGIKLIELKVNELENELFKRNDELRCYYCKFGLLSKIKEVAKSNNIDRILDGTNYDDVRTDYRPGIRALKELEILSPLRDNEFTKEEIRKLSKEFKLKTWDRPPLGCCLATRFRYGIRINEERLEKLRKMENYLRSLGLTLDRARYHDDNTIRIETLPQEMDVIMKNREQIVKMAKGLGFKYISMDLQGYRTGSMNEVLR